jgi:anti-sigma factor RsiW
VSKEKTHLTSDLLQAYLEDELDRRQRSRVEAHLGECRRCAAELEGWSLLFRELDELPAMGPSPGFRQRVLAQVPVRPAGEAASDEAERGFWQRLVAAVTGAGRSASEHLSPERLQDLAEGLLTGRRRKHARAHVAACGTCRNQVEEWQFLFRKLEALPELAPSPEFADRVMAAVDLAPVPAPAPAPEAFWKRLPADALAAARSLVPTTRKGWALAGSAVAAPAVAFLALVGAVVAHPLLTVGDLAAFLWWRTGDLAGLAGNWVLARFVESPLLGWAWALVEVVATSPALAAGGIALLWGTTLLAAWVLYRNVIQPFFALEQHVR